MKLLIVFSWAAAVIALPTANPAANPIPVPIPQGGLSHGHKYNCLELIYTAGGGGNPGSPKGGDSPYPRGGDGPGW
ncbi:hypothetical protein Vi05172_g9838 [Venturia inaequalis]|nr:hypothetical protein Vi05172_g9838 [Venturia inaequalis]